MSHFLSLLQLDALCEIFNIGVGRAAAAMSSLVAEEVKLSVPSMRFCTLAELDERVVWARWPKVDAMVQHFKGSFEGDALLMFSQDDCNEAVRLLLRRVKGGEAQNLDLGEDAKIEIGNILLNACLASLAGLIDEDFDCSITTISSGTGTEVMSKHARSNTLPILFLHIQFQLERKKLEGYMAFLMEMDALNGLRAGVDRFLQQLEKKRGSNA